MASSAFPAVLVGLFIGLGLWIIDRRFAPAFAESAGFDRKDVRSGPGLAAYLVGSPAIAYALLSVRSNLGSALIYQAIVVAILLWVASIDWRWRIIPNRIVYPSTLAAIVLSPLAQTGPLLHAVSASLIGLGVSGGVFLLFFLLSILIYRRASAFGAGDVKLAGFVGAALGYPSAVAAVFIATFAGAIFAVAWGVIHRSRKAGFPYGPAIVAGAIVALLVYSVGR